MNLTWSWNWFILTDCPVLCIFIYLFKINATHYKLLNLIMTENHSDTTRRSVQFIWEYNLFYIYISLPYAEILWVDLQTPHFITQQRHNISKCFYLMVCHCVIVLETSELLHYASVILHYLSKVWAQIFLFIFFI